MFVASLYVAINVSAQYANVDKETTLFLCLSGEQQNSPDTPSSPV